MLGSPIGHSLSPVLHRAAYRELGLDWEYEAIDCDVPALAGTLGRLAGTHAGLSLTMPLKEAVLPLLAEVTSEARDIGAVNTVVFADGALDRRLGYNTDVIGVLAALEELGIDPAGEPVGLLGAGGAARAVLAALARRGVGEVVVVVRTPARAAGLLDLARRLGVAAQVRPCSPRALVGVRLAISAVPATAAGTMEGLGSPSWPVDLPLFDLSYAPWPTPLAAIALAAGAPVVGGLPMLVAQAAEQVRLMTGRRPPTDVMRSAGEAALSAG